MHHTILDRLLVFFVLELAHLLFVLTAAESPLGARVSSHFPSTSLPLLIVVDGILLALCAWLPWFVARTRTVVRVFGALLAVGSVLLLVSDTEHAAGPVTLAGLGLVLLVDGMGKVPRREPLVPQRR